MTPTTDFLIQDNVVGKYAYQILSHAEIKTFCFLLQQTRGWNRDSAAISTSFFISGTKDQMGTNLSPFGQRKAVKALLNRGWISIVGHEDMRMAGHSVKVPVYEISWAAIQNDYRRWMEGPATVVAPPPATVVAPAIGAATVVAPVPQLQLPPSRNRSCPLIIHTPIEHTEKNIPGYVDESAAPLPEEMTFFEWLTGEKLEPVEDKPESEEHKAFMRWFCGESETMDEPLEQHPIGQTEGEDSAAYPPLVMEEIREGEPSTGSWGDSPTEEELTTDHSTGMSDDTLSANDLDLLLAKWENIQDEIADAGEGSRGQAPHPISAAPSPRQFLRVATLAAPRLAPLARASEDWRRLVEDDWCL